MPRIPPPNRSTDATDFEWSFDGEARGSDDRLAAGTLKPREQRNNFTIVQVEGANSLDSFDIEPADSDGRPRTWVSAPATLDGAGDLDPVSSFPIEPRPATVESTTHLTTATSSPIVPIEHERWWWPDWTRYRLETAAAVSLLGVLFLSLWRGGAGPTTDPPPADQGRTSIENVVDVGTIAALSVSLPAIPVAVRLEAPVTAVDERRNASARSSPSVRAPIPERARSPERVATKPASPRVAPSMPSASVVQAQPQIPASARDGAIAGTRDSPPDTRALVDRPAPAVAAPVASNDDRPVPATPPAARVPARPALATSERLTPPIAESDSAVSEKSTLSDDTQRDVDGIQRVLQRYQVAYERLDASAAKAVWPTVDVRALSRAFDGLLSQEITFDRCDLRVSGTSARASCHGSGTFVPKVGSRDPRIVKREWAFQLQKIDDTWTIENTEIR